MRILWRANEISFKLLNFYLALLRGQNDIVNIVKTGVNLTYHKDKMWTVWLLHFLFQYIILQQMKMRRAGKHVEDILPNFGILLRRIQLNSCVRYIISSYHCRCEYRGDNSVRTFTLFMYLRSFRNEMYIRIEGEKVFSPCYGNR